VAYFVLEPLAPSQREDPFRPLTPAQLDRDLLLRMVQTPASVIGPPGSLRRRGITSIALPRFSTERLRSGALAVWTAFQTFVNGSFTGSAGSAGVSSPGSASAGGG